MAAVACRPAAAAARADADGRGAARVPARERSGRRDDGPDRDLDRPCDRVGPGERTQRAHGSHFFAARIDVVVVSHNHYDHLDRDSIESLARQPGGPPLFLVPLGIKAWMARLGVERVSELDWWEQHEHGGVEFHFTPTQHWSARGIRDRNRTLWGAWSVLGVDLHWFFSGDTGYSADFADTRRHFAERQTADRGGGFDVALIAVGACEPRWFMREQHVDPEEAVQIHLDLGAKRSVGVHWGTFQLSDEPLDHPIEALPLARARLGVSEDAFSLMAIGQSRRFARRPRQ